MNIDMIGKTEIAGCMIDDCNRSEFSNFLICATVALFFAVAVETCDL